jgi:hypothetical protein
MPVECTRGGDETSAHCDFAMERMAQVLKANNTLTRIHMVRCLFLLFCAAVVYSIFSRTTFHLNDCNDRL